MGIKPALLTLVGVATAVGGGTGIYLLSQDKTTIKDKLEEENLELIGTDDEYEVSFKEFKDTTNYINLIKGNNNSLSAQSPLNEGGPALKRWCENNLNLRLATPNSEKIIENIKNYCSKSSLTIEAKLGRASKSLSDNWSNKLVQLKSSSGNGALLTDLQTIKTDLTSLDATDAHTILESWCKKHIKTELIKDKNEAIWTKVNNRCLK